MVANIEYESLKDREPSHINNYVPAPPEICDTENLAEDVSLYCPSVEIKQSKFISCPQNVHKQKKVEEEKVQKAYMRRLSMLNNMPVLMEDDFLEKDEQCKI